MWRYFVSTFKPYALIGIACVAAISLLGLAAYIAFWGLLLGGLLWLTRDILNRILGQKTPKNSPLRRAPRIIEHE